MQGSHLVEFVAIAQEGSLSAAAGRLNVSQPALSRHMQALEQSLDLRLFDRSTSGIVLTEEGRFIYNKAADIVDSIDDIASYATARTAALTVPICGMTIYPLEQAKLQERCENMKFGGREVELKFLPANMSFSRMRFVEALDKGKTDIYLVISSSKRLERLDSRFTVLPLFESPLVAVMDAGNPLASKKSLSPADLEGRLFLHSETDTGCERENWADTKLILQDMGITYRAKTCALEEQASLSADLKRGILLFPQAYSGVAVLQATGKAVVPVQGYTKRISAVIRKGDRLARKVVKKLAD